jgi:hypothetical protein
MLLGVSKGCVTLTDVPRYDVTGTCACKYPLNIETEVQLRTEAFFITSIYTEGEKFLGWSSSSVSYEIKNRKDFLSLSYLYFCSLKWQVL